MHDGEVHTDEALVKRLLRVQFPQWADLPILRLRSAGTDNALYRLGEDKVVRLPRIDWAIGQVEKESYWLPKLAPFLPFAIPVPLVKGKPGEGYPWEWAVYKWLEGESATPENINDLSQTAVDLANFIIALQNIDIANARIVFENNTNNSITKLMNITLNLVVSITLCSALSNCLAPKFCPTKVAAALLKPQAGNIKKTTFLIAI